MEGQNKGQQSIPVGRSPDPKPQDHNCEWCDEKANHGIQMINGKGVGVGRWMFACDQHRELAEKNKRIRSSAR